MGAETEIAWCHSTFNPWWGCTRVSPGCENCYAETFAHRLGLAVWGTQTERRLFSDKHWAEPRKWNRDAAASGERRRVFCASMSDVFEDRRDLDAHRARLWSLIEETPHLDWLLLTKRPQHMIRLASASWRAGWPPNAWAGCTVEDQRRADWRHPYLAAVPARVRFYSAEPLLERVRLPLDGVHWVIVGGESGRDPRPFDLAWAAEIIGQCRAAGAAPFVKQLGAWPIAVGGLPALRDAKGGDPSEWPMELRVREFPALT